MFDAEHAQTPTIVRDRERLATLESYGVLDTEPEAPFDDIVFLAAEICEAPSASISLVSAERQWFKARIGIEASETPVDRSICAHALGEAELFVIPDLAKDARSAANPLVACAPGLRFYAGVVLRSPEGQAIGSLCVLDVKPRPGGLTAGQSKALRALARQVMSMLEMRRSLIRSVDDRLDQVRVQRASDAAAAALQAQELTLRLAIDATSMGIFDFDLVSGELTWDGRVRELFGLPPTAPVTYEGAFLSGVHPDDRDAADRAVKAALDPAGPGLFDHEYRTVAPDGTVRWLSARGQSVFAGDAVVRFIGTVRDVTVRRTADEQIQASLDRYRLIGQVTKDVIWDWDLVRHHVVWNEALTIAYGYRLQDVEPTPGWWLERVHPDDRERVRVDIFRVIEGEERDWTHEYRFLRADGSWADVYDRGGMIRDAGGKPLRMIGAMFDNSERKAEQERQRLLANELSHRMKNLMAMVQSIAAQTLRGTGTAQEAQAMLAGRLSALARAHDILLKGEAEGSRLAAVIEEAVSLHRDGPDRIVARGPDAPLGPKAALPLVLMLHELGTNALKYGALSTAEGRVSIGWSVVGRPGEETFQLVWTERGGPPVETPKRKGFGTRLIERGLAGQLGAEVTLDYRPEGFRCDLAAPLARLREAN